MGMSDIRAKEYSMAGSSSSGNSSGDRDMGKSRDSKGDEKVYNFWRREVEEDECQFCDPK